mmetsp:Transcript_7122/g.13048  ORF Transcript_7122/g.13048 Transcript_7122/m.13048 type:complete len:621 (+) Transcript_7122:384-2246(+)
MMMPCKFTMNKIMIPVVSVACLLLGHATAQKVNLHEINEKGAFIRSSSLSARTSSSAASTSQQTYADESATNINNGNGNESEEGSDSNGNSSSNTNIDSSNSFSTNSYHSPFLSATLPTELSPVPFAQEFNSDVKAAYSSAYSQFLEKVFLDQQVYNVKILSVNIFDGQVVPILEAAASSSSTSHHVQPSMETPQTKYFFGIGSRTKVSSEYGTLTFDAVVSAERVSQQQQRQEQQQATLTNDNFKKILIHVSHKFNSHLVEFLQNTGEEYFMDLEKVMVDDFETVAEDLEALGYTVEGHTSSASAATSAVKSSDHGDKDEGGVSVAGLKGESLNTASIVAIVFGSLAFIVLAFATLKLYRREQQLKRNRWRSREISNSAANSSMVGSLKVLYQKPHHPDDDYSFNPLGTDSTYTGILQNKCRDSQLYSKSNIGRQSQHPPRYLPHPRSFMPTFTSHRPHPDQRNGYSNVSLTETNTTNSNINNNDNNNTSQKERKDSFTSVWPQSTPLFPPPPMHSLDGDNDGKDWPIEPTDDPIKPVVRQHVYAPPGKVGVAIDVINGQPVVHKVKKGSPLEGLLKPMDIVVAIDDVDTTCMSAADVTHLMVKRMNYRRKISVVRPEE